MNVQGWVRQVGAGEDGPRSDQGNHHSTWPTPAAVRGSRPPSRFASQQSGPDQASRVSSAHSGRDHLNEAHIVRAASTSSDQTTPLGPPAFRGRYGSVQQTCLRLGNGMLDAYSAAEVVALVEVWDQSGVFRPPSQELAGQRA